MSAKINQNFVNFVNQKKIKPYTSQKENNEEPEDNTNPQERKYKIVMKTNKNENVNEDKLKAPKVDESQNDGSLKALLSRMTGTVINKVVESKVSTNNVEEQGEEESEGSNESDDYGDSESEDDYEEERYNHFGRNMNIEVEDDEEIENEEEEIEDFDQNKNKKEMGEQNRFNDKQSHGKEKRKVECEIFAENIPFNKDEKQIVKFFKNLNNKIVKVKVLKDKDTGKSKGKAFIKFFSQEDAQEMMNRKIKLDGTPITLTFVKKFDNPNSGDNNQKQNQRDNSNTSKNFDKFNNKIQENKKETKPFKTPVNNNLHTAFIRNLPLLLDESKVNKNFKSFGKIKTVRLMKTGEGKSKGFGYIDFESEEGLNKAIKESSLSPIIIEGKQIVVEKAKSSFNDKVYEDGKRLGKKKQRVQERKNNQAENGY
jgi:RNA recognition motif-containing protein